jgi:hypothetical protein
MPTEQHVYAGVALNIHKNGTTNNIMPKRTQSVQAGTIQRKLEHKLTSKSSENPPPKPNWKTSPAEGE